MKKCQERVCNITQAPKETYFFFLLNFCIKIWEPISGVANATVVLTRSFDTTRTHPKDLNAISLRNRHLQEQILRF